MKKIKDYIESGNLDLAREMIESLEIKLTEEPSPRMHEILKSQILDLKKLYSSKLKLSFCNVKCAEQANQLKLSTKNKFGGAYGKLVLDGINHKHFVNMQCKSIDLTDCDGVTAAMIECEETVFLKNVRNSTITLKTKHLRLSNCRNLYLYVFSHSGVFMLDSTNIKIEPISDCELKVFDFNSPVDSKNFQILNK